MIDPEHDRREIDHAASLCELGRFDEAIDRLGQVLARAPEDLDALLVLTQALLGAGQPRAALEQARRAIMLAPQLAAPQQLASIAARQLDDREPAVRHAEVAVELSPDEPGTLITLAEALIMRGPQRDRRPDLQRARVAAATAVSIAPQAAATHFVLGRALTAAGDRKSAATAYRSTLEIDPQHASAITNLAALAHTRPRRMPEATVIAPAARAGVAEGFARALAADPRHTLARRNLDQVTRGFLIALAWIIVVDAQITRWLWLAHPNAPRLVPMLPLIVVVITAVRYYARLSPPLRAHLRRIIVLERPITAAIALLGLGAAGLAAGCFASPATRSTLMVLTGVPAAIGWLVLLLQADRHARPRGGSQPMLRSGILWLVAIGLAILGMAGVTVVDGGNAPAFGFVFTFVCFGGAAAVLVVLLRRRVARD